MNRVALELTDVHHIKLCYSKDTYCGHPRQCPIHNYGNGEIVVIHHHAPATYQTRENIRHGHAGYKGRAKILLQRSLDHGQTWLHENDVVIWDDSRPLEEKRAILWQADEPGVPREQIDLTSPDAAIYLRSPVDRSRRCRRGADPRMLCLPLRRSRLDMGDCPDTSGTTAAA